MPHRYLVTPFTQFSWASPTHYFIISYLGILWRMGYPFSCKADKAWTRVVLEECVQLIMKNRWNLFFWTVIFSFSLRGRRTQFSLQLLSSILRNLVNPSDCYQRDSPLLTCTQIKPMTKSVPTIPSYRRKWHSSYSYANVLFVFA